MRFNELLGEKIAVHCHTKEEATKLLTYFLTKINSNDYSINTLFDTYGDETCIDFQSLNEYETNYVWEYADVDFYKESKWRVVKFDDIDMAVRGFEIVEAKKNKDVEITLPVRGTKKAMAYDFFSPQDYAVAPGEIVKIWTDVKAYMQDTECLILNVRSSMGGKFMLANTQGWIDADYYNNPNNEGNIGIFLKNISEETQFIMKDSRIGQGAFFNFLVADNCNSEEVRTGGFGSTNK